MGPPVDVFNLCLVTSKERRFLEVQRPMASNIFYLLVRVTWNLVGELLLISAFTQSKWIAYGVLSGTWYCHC